MAWRTKIRQTVKTSTFVSSKIAVGDDVVIRVEKVKGGLAVVVDAPAEKAIRATKEAFLPPKSERVD